jgi:hypothetical protein
MQALSEAQVWVWLFAAPLPERTMASCICVRGAKADVSLNADCLLQAVA